MTNTNSHFNSKEQYLTFRAAWAQSINEKATGHYTRVRAEHHLLYNILRGQKPSKGFTTITNLNKLDNGRYKNDGYYWSGALLRNAQKAAQYIIEHKDDPKFDWILEHRQNVVNRLLFPFNGTVTIEMLVEVELPHIIANEEVE